MTYQLCRLALVTKQPIDALWLVPDAVTLATLLTCHNDLQWEAQKKQK